MVESPQLPGKGERVVVVSPHLDDGVLSLGASMHSWTRSRARVELVTVLACDPLSKAPAGGWDERGGFATEGASALARRIEDESACRRLSVTSAWLPYGSVDYERHGDEDAVVDDVTDALEGADVALLPGFPLSHPDHEWLVRTLLGRELPVGRVAFYAEQPYASRSDAAPELPAWVAELIGSAPPFVPMPRVLRDIRAKATAIQCYRSQLPLLALEGRRAHILARSRELVAWVDA